MNSDFFKNSAWLFANHLAKLFGGYVISFWLASYLGPAEFGHYSYVLAFVAMLGPMANAGLQGLAVREFVKRPDQFDEVFSTVFLSKSAFGFLGFALCCGYGAWLGEERGLLIALLGAKLLLSGFQGFDLYCDSLMRSEIRVIARLAGYLASIGFFIALILLQCPVGWFIGALVLAEIISAGLVFILFRRKLPQRRTKLVFNLEYSVKILKASVPLIISGMGAMAYLKMDQIMIVEMIGEEQGGIYSAAARFSEALYVLPTIFLASYFPIMLKSMDNRVVYERRLKTLILVALLVSIAIATAFQFLSEPIVRLTIGEEYLESVAIMKTHVWSLPLAYLGQILSRWLIAEELTRFSVLRHGLGFIANILLNLILIPRFGGLGAAYAFIISLLFSVVLFSLASKSTLHFTKLLIASPALLWRKGSS